MFLINLNEDWKRKSYFEINKRSDKAKKAHLRRTMLLKLDLAS